MKEGFKISRVLLVLSAIWMSVFQLPGFCGLGPSLDESRGPFAPDARSEALRDYVISMSGPVSVIHTATDNTAAAVLAREAEVWLDYLAGRLEKVPRGLRIILAEKASWVVLSARPWGSVDTGEDSSEAFVPGPGTRIPRIFEALESIPWEKLSETENGEFRKTFDFGPNRGYYTIKRGIEENAGHRFDILKAELFLVLAEVFMSSSKLSGIPGWARRAAAIALMVEFPDLETPWLMKWRIFTATVTRHCNAPAGWRKIGLTPFLRDFNQIGPLEAIWFDGRIAAVLVQSGGTATAERILVGLAAISSGDSALSTKKTLESLEAAGVRLK